jgi:DNA topoisomerase-1
MNLVIVEKPGQAKTLAAVLGDGWRVEPCCGMVRDLPGAELGIDLADDFRPTFAVPTGQGHLARRLIKALRECEAVYAATPPGRDGELMAWHVLALAPEAEDKPTYRVSLPSLTAEAIRAAFAAPRPLDLRQIDAHLTRRLIERLITWSINAQARDALGFKTALSGDSMVALRLAAERDSAIAAFTPQTGWRAAVTFVHNGVRFTAPVLNASGAPLTIRDAQRARQLETLLRHGAFWVDRVAHGTKAHPAPSGLALHTLIETAERDLALIPERTLALVGTLYDAGWITHPDAELPASLSDAAQAYIRRAFGADDLNADAVVSAGIAPADVHRRPDDLPGDGAALYALIWRHFLAAHLSAAQEKVTGARILVGAAVGEPYPLELRAAARRLDFDGWRRVLPAPAADAPMLPALLQGDALEAAQVVVEAVPGEPPRPFTRAALVGALVATGLSARSAVTAVEGLLTAGYLSADERLTLTPSGRTVSTYLAAAFDDLTSPAYAAQMHADIARIASGERARPDALRAFWSRFGAALQPASRPGRAAASGPIRRRAGEEG